MVTIHNHADQFHLTLWDLIKTFWHHWLARNSCTLLKPQTFGSRSKRLGMSSLIYQRLRLLLLESLVATRMALPCFCQLSLNTTDPSDVVDWYCQLLLLSNLFIKIFISLNFDLTNLKHCFSMSIRCSSLYLEEFRRTNPGVLANGKNIVGDVFIHPSAKIHPTAKVSCNLLLASLGFESDKFDIHAILKISPGSSDVPCYNMLSDQK